MSAAGRLGLAIGTVCALVAIAPAALERGGRLPVTAGGAMLLFAVFLAGLLSSVVATRAALQHAAARGVAIGVGNA